MASRVEQHSRRALRIASGVELATFEAVESAVGREEAEPVLVTGDNPGRPVPDFDNIGFGHACSFATVSALPLIHVLGLKIRTTGISDSFRLPRRRSGASCGCAYRPLPACHLVSCGPPQQRSLSAGISGESRHWSTKWLSNFAAVTHLLCYRG